MSRAVTASGGPGLGAVPGPRGRPLLGSSLELLRDPLGTYQQAMQVYGDVVRFVVGPPGRRVVLHALFDPEDVRQVLAGSHGHTKNTPFYREIAATLGDGLLTSDGTDWQRQRRLLQPLFTRQRIAGDAAAMADETTRLLQELKVTAAMGGPVDLHQQMMRYTMRVIGRLLFGTDIDRAIGEVDAAFPVLNQRIRQRALSAIRWPGSWPTPANRRAAAARRRLDQVVDQIIANRRAGPATGGDDLVARLLAARDPEGGDRLDDAEVADQVRLFLLAGHETTATALTFTLHLLGHHPAVQQRIRAEVRRVLADRVPTAADAASLAYTTRVLKEAMRLYPPAYSIARRTSTAERIGGYQLPAGSVVIISPWAIHRHPRHWAQPEVFDPDRFTPDREAARHRYAYLPFAAGPRACIGGHFAMLEAVIATAMIIRAHHLRTPPGPVPLATGITLRPAAPVPCTLLPTAPHNPSAT
jgi:cytochrome P450